MLKFSMEKQTLLFYSEIFPRSQVRELWSLFDWLACSRLLGSWRTFKEKFADPIEQAAHADATGAERRLGRARAEALRKLVKPYILTRTKADYLVKDTSHHDGQPAASGGSGACGQQQIPPKHGGDRGLLGRRVLPSA